MAWPLRPPAPSAAPHPCFNLGFSTAAAPSLLIFCCAACCVSSQSRPFFSDTRPLPGPFLGFAPLPWVRTGCGGGIATCPERLSRSLYLVVEVPLRQPLHLGPQTFDRLLCFRLDLLLVELPQQVPLVERQLRMYIGLLLQHLRLSSSSALGSFLSSRPDPPFSCKVHLRGLACGAQKSRFVLPSTP